MSGLLHRNPIGTEMSVAPVATGPRSGDLPPAPVEDARADEMVKGRLLDVASGDRVLTRGCRGKDVEFIQTCLNANREAAGLGPIKVDGIFGKETDAAVRMFQSRSGLSPDAARLAPAAETAGIGVDGRVGILTMRSFLLDAEARGDVPSPLQALNVPEVVEKVRGVLRNLTKPADAPVKPTELPKPSPKPDDGSESKVVDTRPKTQDTFIRVVPTDEKNKLGNPIVDIELYNNGKLEKTLKAVTGRAFTQERDRDVAGTEAPLPDGRYSIGVPMKSSVVETGGQFLPVTPQFKTGRSALGFHVDPSFGVPGVDKDGTRGCLGLLNEDDRNVLHGFVEKFKPSYMEVDLKK